MPPKMLQLLMVGNPPAGLLKDVEEPLLAQLGLTASRAPAQLPAPSYAYNKDRKQYHSNAIMRRLAQQLEPGVAFQLALTDADLFVPDSPFLFGDADREAKVGLVSVFRLKEGAKPDVLKRRVQVEAIHQAGHLMGLSYCEDARCVMFLAANVAECDRKNSSLCNLCRNELVKISR